MNCDVFKRTSDDWCPSYFLQQGQGLVEVSFLQTESATSSAHGWLVCAWGGDDCGLEKAFESETEAWCCFLQVIGLENVTMRALIDLGFITA